jgi:hypothetical protein
VRLEKLGNFQVSLSSEGFATQEEVTASAVKKSRILFRPAKKMRDLLKDLSFSKVGKLTYLINVFKSPKTFCYWAYFCLTFDNNASVRNFYCALTE